MKQDARNEAFANLRLFACNSHPELAQEIAEHMGVELSKSGNTLTLTTKEQLDRGVLFSSEKAVPVVDTVLLPCIHPACALMIQPVILGVKIKAPDVIIGSRLIGIYRHHRL